MKTCSKCGQNKEYEEFYQQRVNKDGYDGFCKLCKKESTAKNYLLVKPKRKVQMRSYAKDYFQKNKQDWVVKAHIAKAKFPEKWKARQNLRNAVALGKVEKFPCKVCGDKKSQGHHEDYSKPLEVIWLCALHHRKLTK